MPFIGNMDNVGSPLLRRGYALVESKNVEFDPAGATSRRRGFLPYFANTTPGTIYDLSVWDRYSGTTQKIDLVARVVKAGVATIKHLNIYSGGLVAGTSWLTMGTSAWSTAAEGGQFFSRNDYLYYSDGALSKGFTESSPFTLGLAAPTGTITIVPDMNVDGRAEGGYYDWTFTGRHEGRNVTSPALGFGQVTSASPTGLQSYYSLGQYPSLGGGSIRVKASGLTFDPKATHWELYRRHPLTLLQRPAGNLSDLRMVVRAAVTQASFTDLFHDGELGQRFTYVGSSPRPWIAVSEHNSRYWYADAAEPWKLRFSEADKPENVAQEVTIDNHQIRPFLVVESGDAAYVGEAWVRVAASAGPIRATVQNGQTHLVLCASETWHRVGSSPRNFRCEVLDSTVGCVGRKAWVRTPRGTFWLTESGVAWAPPNEHPRVIPFDMDSAGSVTRLNRSLLHLACAAYDPEGDTVEFAVPSSAASGNDIIVAMDLAAARPVAMVYHVPTMKSGELITAMTTVRIPSQKAQVLYGTNRGRTLYRAASTFYDMAGATPAPIAWKMAGWLGTRRQFTQQESGAIWLMQFCKYPASVGASWWGRHTMVPPTTGDAPDDQGTILCSASAYGQYELAGGGFPYVFLTLRETASTPFEIHGMAGLAEEDTGFGAEGATL